MEVRDEEIQFLAGNRRDLISYIFKSDALGRQVRGHSPQR